MRHALGRQFAEDHDERRDDDDVEQNSCNFLRMMILHGLSVDGLHDQHGDSIRENGAQQRQQCVDEHVPDQNRRNKMLLIFK